MRNFLRPALCLSLLLAVAACDEAAMVGKAPPAVPTIDQVGRKSCVAAVAEQTGNPNVTLNTTIPIIETNRYIVDVPGGALWTCVTDVSGQARELVEQQSG